MVDRSLWAVSPVSFFKKETPVSVMDEAPGQERAARIMQCLLRWIPGWVNCKSRAAPFPEIYEKIFEKYMWTPSPQTTIANKDQISANIIQAAKEDDKEETGKAGGGARPG